MLTSRQLWMAVTMALIVALHPALAAAQRPVAGGTEASALQSMTAALPLGVQIRVQTTAGRKLTGTLLAVDDVGVTVKRATRVPEPAVLIRWSELTRLQRHEPGGVSVGKVVGIGLAAGAGAILTLFAIVSVVFND